MVFNKKGNQYINNPNFTLKIGSNAIDEVTFTKFLGLYIDNKLQWTNHIKHCKSKIASSLYAIRTAKHVLSYEHMRTLYFCMIHPYLDWPTFQETSYINIYMTISKLKNSCTNSFAMVYLLA